MPARHPRPAMGIATDKTYKNKLIYYKFLQSFETIDTAKSSERLFQKDARIDAAHPINHTSGGSGYYADIVLPLLQSFAGLQRQNQILIGGEFQGTEWVTSTGYYCGHFHKPWLGIAPSNTLQFVRFGEFHQMRDEKIVASHIYLGVAELIIALGRWPLAPSQGYEGVVPGPASHDGVQLNKSDPIVSRQSADNVESMLMELTSKDALWRPYWDQNMFWYGPGGFGSYVTVDAFHDFQVPFEQTFEGWGDGQREGITGVCAQCKAGDGDYSFMSGWPAITGVQIGRFMGIEATGKRIYLRDCDWWRCRDGKIVENWCMVDTLHLAHQLEYDVIAAIAN